MDPPNVALLYSKYFDETCTFRFVIGANIIISHVVYQYRNIDIWYT